MDYSILGAAVHAFVVIIDPLRLTFLGAGVVLGLTLGIIPGIGGLTGTALLLPFTYALDPYTAFAFLLGLGATTTTGDPIPAILFGVPGGAASAATVLDGLPMAKRGEAGRALSAAYMASMLGGVFGALLMAAVIPIVRPVILYLGSPELFAFSIFGISMVAVLSGSAPLRGLVAAGLGIMLAMIGTDPQTGTPRWTMDALYLWDGLPLFPLVLGVFALPELCDLAISRSAIGSDAQYSIKEGMIRGARDCFVHWWLVLRCSWIGATFGAIPGVGGSVIDWVAYGHALRTEKGAAESFGKGDVRGVIASESSNNAKEGGALIPTVVFGIPGSAGMAILLGAFLIQGLVPGPNMLSKHLDVTYSMVWSIAIANILGAGLCYLFSGHFARLATLRYTLILPTVLSVIYIGAFEGSRSWGDLYSLLCFGVLGWVMKQLKWPRPPLILGFILGDLIERYLFISVERYGVSWFTRPVVIILFAMALYGLLRPFLREMKVVGGLRGIIASAQRPRFATSQLFYLVLIALFLIMLAQAADWPFNARLVPMVIGIFVTVMAVLSLLNQIFVAPLPEEVTEPGASESKRVQRSIHMDISADTGHLSSGTIAFRGTLFFGWLVAFMASMAVIGLIPTVPLFVVSFMRLEAREAWKLVLPQAIGLTAFIYFVFDWMLSLPWPPTLAGSLFPILHAIPSM
jgi:TctA family transporter